MYPSVAELVKKYQDYLPPSGVEDLTKTALAPGVPVSESEQETVPPIRSRVRHKTRQPFLTKRSSVSDFESSYAANIAPKYLTKRTSAVPGSRIPVVPVDSRDVSRRTSPDKRPSFSRTNTDLTVRAGRTSPPSARSTVPASGSKSRPKPNLRLGPKDKTPARPSSVINSKSTFRRPPANGAKVANIAKHFERMNRENERAGRRFAVIRGKRPRPVASARAKVEVLESIKDVIMDESESSDSSEADDEGGGEDDDNLDQKSPKKPGQKIPETPPPPPDVVLQPAEGPTSTTSADSGAQNVSTGAPAMESLAPDCVTPLQEIEVPPSVLNSPMLSPMGPGMMPMTPPPTDMDIEPSGRPSILKALTGLWPQQAPPRNRAEVEPDDPMADPEHIFRDSSMVVRTDEPTSIIALALKYVPLLASLFRCLTICIVLPNTATCLPGLVRRSVWRESWAVRHSCLTTGLLRNRHRHGVWSMWTAPMGPTPQRNSVCRRRSFPGQFVSVLA